MASTIADLLVGLGLDMQDLKDGLDEADGLLQGFAGGLNKIGDAATAAFTVPIVDGLNDMIGAASNAQDVVALLTVHLQDNQKSAQQAATSVGYWSTATSGSTKEIGKLSKEIDNQKEKIAEHMQAWDLETHSAKAHDNAVIGMQVHLNALTGQYDAATASTKVWVGANSDGIPVLTTTVDKLEDVAMALEKTTAFSHVNIEAAQAILLTYHAIGNDTFPQATQATLDIAASMGTTATQAALQLGKALDDPIRGITNLRRVGIVFNDAVTQQVKTLMQQNNVLAAQKVILDQVESQFGGTASAMAQTFQGRLDQLSNAWNDLIIELGTPIINELAPMLQTAADAVYTFTGALQNSDLGWVVFAAGIAAVIAGLGPLFGLVAGIVAPIVLVSGIVGALGLAFATNFGGLKDIVQGAYDSIKPILDNIGNAVNNVLGAIAGPGNATSSTQSQGGGILRNKDESGSVYGAMYPGKPRGNAPPNSGSPFGNMGGPLNGVDSIGANVLGDGGAQGMASQSSDLGTRIKAALDLSGINVDAILKPLNDIKKAISDFFDAVNSGNPAQLGYLAVGLASIGGALMMVDIAGKISAIASAILGMSIGPLLPIVLLIGALTWAASTNFGGFATTLGNVKDAIDKIGPVGQAAGFALLGTTLALKLLFGVPLTAIASGLLSVAGGIAAMTLAGAAGVAMKISELLFAVAPAGASVILTASVNLAAVAKALMALSSATGLTEVVAGIWGLAGALMALLFPVLVIAVPLGLIYAYFTDPNFAALVNRLGDAIRTNLAPAIAGLVKSVPLLEPLFTGLDTLQKVMGGSSNTPDANGITQPGAGNGSSSNPAPGAGAPMGKFNPNMPQTAASRTGAGGNDDALGIKSGLQATIDWLTNIAPPLVSAAAAKFMKALTNSITGSATTVEFAIETSISTATTWINGTGVSLAGAAATNIVKSMTGIFQTAGNPLVTSVRNALLGLAGMFGAMGQGAGLQAQADILAGMGVKTFADGGFTGNGSGVVGGVHGGEFVVPKNGVLVTRDSGGGSGGGQSFQIGQLIVQGVTDVPSLLKAIQKEAGRQNLTVGTAR